MDTTAAAGMETVATSTITAAGNDEDVVMSNASTSEVAACPGHHNITATTNHEILHHDAVPDDTIMTSIGDGETHNAASAARQSPNTNKRRKVSFHVGFATDVHEIPPLTEYDKNDDDPDDYNIMTDLFYNDADYERFRTNEQRRYDKMVAKKIQRMVQDKMQGQINEAVAQGATLEDVEAMMPKTHEEMVAILGGSMPSAFGGNPNPNPNGNGNGGGGVQRSIRSSRSSISATSSRNGASLSAAAADLVVQEDEIMANDHTATAGGNKRDTANIENEI